MYISNTIVDGLSTLKNIDFKFNNKTGFLDVSSFECLYEPFDNTLTSYIGTTKQKEPMKTMKFV
jgi:hypothetical protein